MPLLLEVAAVTVVLSVPLQGRFGNLERVFSSDTVAKLQIHVVYAIAKASKICNIFGSLFLHARTLNNSNDKNYKSGMFCWQH